MLAFERTLKQHLISCRVLQYCHDHYKLLVLYSKLVTDLLKAWSDAEGDVDEYGLYVILGDLAEDPRQAAHRLQSDHVVDVVLVIHAGHHRRQNHRTELLHLTRGSISVINNTLHSWQNEINCWHSKMIWTVGVRGMQRWHANQHDTNQQLKADPQ